MRRQHDRVRRCAIWLMKPTSLDRKVPSTFTSVNVSFRLSNGLTIIIDVYLYEGARGSAKGGEVL